MNPVGTLVQTSFGLMTAPSSMIELVVMTVFLLTMVRLSMIEFTLTRVLPYTPVLRTAMPRLIDILLLTLTADPLHKARRMELLRTPILPLTWTEPILFCNIALN